jgi:hypothetical protein
MRTHNELDSYNGPEPHGVNEHLRRRHGDGFMGFPLYRLVHTAFLFRLSGGEWVDWDENLPIDKRGNLVADETGTAPAPNTRCERHKLEIRRVCKYPEFASSPGWMLERWMAPAYFGTPSEWNSRVVPGTTLSQLGPYPYQGQYISTTGYGFLPYPQAPTGPFLDRIIEQWNLMRDETLAMSAGAYIRKRDFEAIEEDREREERWNRDQHEAHMVVMNSFLSTFLEGGRARQQAAERCGVSSNYGN